MHKAGRTLATVTVAALALVLVSASPAARESDAGQVLAGLQSWLDATRDLEAIFDQTLESGALGAGLAESGRVYVRRPGKMRWNYQDPERKVAIVDGDRTWLYVAAERQLILGRLAEGQGGLLPALLAAERDLAELFDPSLVATPEGAGDGVVRLRLVPRADADVLEQVVVTLRPPQFAIEEVEVLDAAGNRMRYSFRRLTRNAGLPDALFRFDPPRGTEIAGSHDD